MGRNSSAACLDCKKQYDIGYGSYSTWMDHHRTVADFDAEAKKIGGPDGTVLGRNACVRALLVEHAGHRMVWWSSDWAYEVVAKDQGLKMGDGR